MKYNRDGYISIRTDTKGKRYKYIRIEVDKWKQLHLFNWEQKFGTIPEGYIIAFKDGNPMNCEAGDTSNLEMTTRADLLRAKKIRSLHDGSIRMRRDTDGALYKYIRTASGIWKQLHLYNWENMVGLVKPDHVICFRDGNTLNCELNDISNLEQITRGNLLKRVTGYDTLSDKYLADKICDKHYTHLTASVLNNKPLLELKKNILLLNREIYVTRTK